MITLTEEGYTKAEKVLNKFTEDEKITIKAMANDMSNLIEQEERSDKR